MATKVALTAEEFRENSQRSIDLFNTEKLSTDSTHVLKSAYCNSVHFCRCNLHGACGGKAVLPMHADGDVLVAICTERVEAKRVSVTEQEAGTTVAICTERVEAKVHFNFIRTIDNRCNLHGACGGKDADISLRFSFPRCNLHGACGGKVVLLGAYNTFYTLQSARGVWKTLHHPPEKNPRKFMQTYCIFIHFGV